MDDLEHYLDRVCRGLGGAASLRRHLRQELREHIQEAAERYKATGLAPDEALQKALGDFGEPGPVHQGLEDVYGRDVMGILIEKAVQWKEKTMKAKWLWSGTAGLFLLVAICAQVFFPFCLLWLVVPRMKEMFKDAGQGFPQYAIRFLGLADFLMLQYGWLWVLAPLLLAWAVFEWRYRGENRLLIRLSALSLVLLTTTALMWWAAIAVGLPMIQMLGYQVPQRPEQVMLEAASRADAAMARLDIATKAQDWQATNAAVGEFRSAFENDYVRGVAPADLVTMTQQQRLSEIRDQLRLLTTLAERVQSAPAEQMPERNQQMQEAYAKLKVLVGDWPQAPASQSTANPTSEAAPQSARASLALGSVRSAVPDGTWKKEQETCCLGLGDPGLASWATACRPWRG